jgi:hypothetical protein
MAVTVEATAITGMVEATAMATVFLGMVIITAIPSFLRL